MPDPCNPLLDSCGNPLPETALGYVAGNGGAQSVSKLIGTQTVAPTIVSEGYIPVVYVEDVNLGLGVYGFNEIANTEQYLFDNDFAAGTLKNGDFESNSATTWQIDAPLAYGGGTLVADGTGLVALVAYQEITLVEGRSYEVTYDVTGYVSDNVTVSLGGTAGTPRAADGTFAETIVAGADGKISFEFAIGAELAIDNVLIATTDNYVGTVARPVAGAFCIEAIAEATIAAGTTSVLGDDPSAGTVIPLGDRLYGNFDAVQISSGSVRVYAFPHKFYVT